MIRRGARTFEPTARFIRTHLALHRHVAFLIADERSADGIHVAPCARERNRLQAAAAAGARLTARCDRRFRLPDVLDAGPRRC